MADKYRTIIYTHRFNDELSAIEPDVQRSDDFLAGVEWVVAKNPGAGQRVGKSSIWYLNFEFEADRTVTLFYTFDTKHVWFMSITATDPLPPF